MEDKKKRGRPRKEIVEGQDSQENPEDADIQDIELLTKFEDKDEKKLAKTLLRKYLTEFQIENIADRNTLSLLIYLEINQLRIQQKMNKMHIEDDGAIPVDLLESMNKNSDAIIKLKNTLGLSKSKEKLAGYDALQHLMRRFKKWGEENQASRHMKCPHCAQFMLLKIKTEAWEAQKHPFFKDTFLYNKKLIDNLNKTVTLDRNFLAEVFEVSPDYIDWVVKRINKTLPTTTATELLETTQPIGDIDGKEETVGQEQKEGQVINGESGKEGTDN